MPLPFIFQNLSGNVPAADLDTNFNAVAFMGVTQTTATGTNSFALAINANQPTITAYSNYLSVSFVAPSTSTGAVTANLNSIGSVPVYLPDGTTQANAENIVQNQLYIMTYNSALNSGAGGFVITNNQGSVTRSNVVVISSTGTYTPSAGMSFCQVYLLGGGAAGGGMPATSGSQYGAGSGGAAGGYCFGVFSATQIGASQTVTIGAAGTGVSGANGNDGGNSSFGTLLTANGGAHGIAGTLVSGATFVNFHLATGGTATGGSVNIAGQIGNSGYGVVGTGAFWAQGGSGGSSPLGAGGANAISNGGSQSNAGTGYGAGGSGAASGNSQGAVAGGAGSPGVCVIVEFIG